MYPAVRIHVAPCVVLCLILCALSCASRQVSLALGPRSFTAADYDRIYAAWTRDADEFAFGRLQNVLGVTATFESWEFRWAYVVRYAQDHGMPTAARGDLLRASLADARAHHRFFITLAGQDWRASDLTGEQSAWRVLLVDDRGLQTPPLTLEKVEHPTPAERVYFPSVSRQRMVFRAVFPASRPDGSATIPPGAPYLVLRFTGALGRVDLRWDLASPRAPSPSE